MAKRVKRSIFLKNGMWVNKRADATKAASIHRTQREAVDAARDMLSKRGGGDLVVHGRNGKIVKNLSVSGRDSKSGRFLAPRVGYSSGLPDEPVREGTSKKKNPRKTKSTGPRIK